jgi:hypothetical protein
VPPEVKSKASLSLASGVPFLSDAQLSTSLDQAGASPEVKQAALDENAAARLDALRAALAILALAALIALFFTFRIPTSQPGGRKPEKSGSPVRRE